MAVVRSSNEAWARFDRPLSSDCAVWSTAVAVLVEGLGGLPVVFVDKATKAVAAHDRPSGSCEADWRSALGCSEVKAAVGTFSVVVIEVGLQDRLEMTFVDNKDPVEALGTNGPNEALGIGIRPRGSPRGANDLH